ncbi:MAG: pyruvate kinase [Deltaproteobacteria bacterium]|nr:pyruvate kinase [Deltaproteobacteria bacterium]MBW2070833.1 pyruvate kinase [Deltaproteobacteria bacterium]
MRLPANKTKIVCTIGPASESVEVLKQLIEAGMNIARINFSHADFDSHEKVIANIRTAARATGRRVAIMGDLPGPKMRIGQLAEEPVQLNPGDPLTLTSEEILGSKERVSMSFPRLPQVVKAGDTLFLNDGLIQLEVEKAVGTEVHCRVVVGGELRSRKGLNLPDIDLGIGAFTERDQQCLRFAMEKGVDAISQSFVESAADIRAVRQAAASLGHEPFIIAKLERSSAREHLDGILDAADGIMVARGDLGVEIPIEWIAVAQKEIIRRANLLGKPVITATQMLESMTDNRRPTRAEATDVANAILDGTDCVMLSEESAMGKYPVDAAAMLAKIAAATEPTRPGHKVREILRTFDGKVDFSMRDLLTLSVETLIDRVAPALVLVPSISGATARSITRFRLPVWIAAVSTREKVCQQLMFSYGIWPVHEPEQPDDWKGYARNWLQSAELQGNLVVLSTGPSPKYPEANHRIEIIDLNR